MNFKNKLIIMNKKDLKKFLIENESHTIENTEEKLLSFVKGTMLNRNDVIDQDDQSHHRQEERLRNQLDKQVHEHHHHLEEIEALTGVFEEVEGEGDADATPRISSPGVIFHAATGIDAATVAPVQTTLQKRILRAFVARGLLENCDAKDMLGYKHSGFSVDAGVCIEAHDRAALERLLRYCARPPFSIERLRKEGSKLVYRCAKQRSEPTSDKRGAKADELHLTPLELIDRIAALVPPPRTHRHRYFGVLAPNSPLRAAVTALAQPAASQPATVETAQPGAGVPGVAAPGNAATPTPEPEARPKRAAHYLWAVLIARIYEAFPLLCPMCGGQMRIIAFITHSAEIRHILNHIGVESAPPRTSPRHAGHRCGRAATRRWMMVRKASRIGIWQLNPHPITR